MVHWCIFVGNVHSATLRGIPTKHYQHYQTRYWSNLVLYTRQWTITHTNTRIHKLRERGREKEKRTVFRHQLIRSLPWFWIAWPNVRKWWKEPSHLHNIFTFSVLLNQRQKNWKKINQIWRYNVVSLKVNYCNTVVFIFKKYIGPRLHCYKWLSLLMEFSLWSQTEGDENKQTVKCHHSPWSACVACLQWLVCWGGKKKHKVSCLRLQALHMLSCFEDEFY